MSITDRYHHLNDRLNALKAAVAISRRLGRSSSRFALEMRHIEDLLHSLSIEENQKMSPRVSADYETLYVRPGIINKKLRKRA